MHSDICDREVMLYHIICCVLVHTIEPYHFSVYIRFHSDASSTGRGFQITVKDTTTVQQSSATANNQGSGSGHGKYEFIHTWMFKNRSLFLIKTPTYDNFPTTKLQDMLYNMT